MRDFIRITELKLKIKDRFSVADLLKVLKEWLTENHYVDLNGRTDYETLYTHALKAGGSFLDSWFWWRCVRYPEGTTKKTAYLRYRINIDMHFLGDAAETEAVSKGKKVKLNKGEINIMITPIVELDFRNEWKDKGLAGLFDEIFKKRMYKKDIDKHVEFLMLESYRLQNMLKQFFRLESTSDIETVSQPPEGLM
ncbi:MAG: hypothetical protein AABW88_02530 [Nanoarchaeota archaeon]